MSMLLKYPVRATILINQVSVVQIVQKLIQSRSRELLEFSVEVPSVFKQVNVFISIHCMLVLNGVVYIVKVFRLSCE